ncbi:Transposase IS4-like domain-containing protein [Deinococcus marmoris]
MTPANVDDREGLKLVLNTFDLDAPLVKKLFLDGGYAGGPFEALAKTTTGIEVEVVRRPDEGITVVGGIAQLPTNTPTEEQFRLAVEMARRGGKGFKVVRKRWVVERTFAWLLTFRRLRVDYEEHMPISEGFIYAAGSCILLTRLCA